MKIFYKIRPISILIILIGFISSCAPVYIPNVANTPLFKEADELHVSINTGFSGFDPQIAYSFTDNFAVQLNGSFYNSPPNDSSVNYQQHSYVEAAAGFYQPFGDIIVLEVFGGFGFGKIRANYVSPLWSSNSFANNYKFFIQPTFGLVSDVVDFSFTPKLSYVNVNQSGFTDYATFFEPVFTFKAGYKYLKFTTQFGLSIQGSSKPINFDYNPFIFSIGAQMQISNLISSFK